MRTNSPLALFLSAVLQIAPWCQSVGMTAAQNGSQVAIAILRWVVGGTAVSGVFHAVSGASITLTNPAGGSVRTTNGVDTAFRVSMTYTEGTKVSTPALYVAANLPPGLNQPSKSGTIWRITGRPTQTGVFSNVRLTGYENSNKTGHNATVVLTLTVVDEAPAITGQPVDLTVTAGQPATLSVTATGGSLTYQWLKGDLEVPGATGASLVLSSARESDSGAYRVRIANSGGSLLSSTATLTVIPGSVAPRFTTIPTGTVLHAGEPVHLSASATGDGPLLWSWTKDGVPLKGNAGPSLSIAAASLSDSGTYVVSVAGPGGTATAPVVKVSVVSPLSVHDSLSGAGILSFHLDAIPGRGYFVEEASPETPGTWTRITESLVAIGGGDPSLEVPLRIDIGEPKSGGHLYRITTH